MFRLRRFLRRAHQDERGQSLIETIIAVFPVCFILLAGILFFGRVFYTSMALDSASFDGARMGIESLSRNQGLGQGWFFAEQTMHSWHLNPEGAEVAIGSPGGWNRGRTLICRVRYSVFVGDIPFAELFYPDDHVRLQSTSYGSIERFKSRWAQ